jgi:hypothetical protein
VECDKLSKSQSTSQLFVVKDTRQEISVLRVEVLREEESVVSLKLLKPKVSKFLISIYHEGVQVSIDRELQEKALRAKESVEELKLLKSEALKPGVLK